ncbi:unnamed protein product, partial [marine sediment metagenome]
EDKGNLALYSRLSNSKGVGYLFIAIAAGDVTENPKLTVC